MLVFLKSIVLDRLLRLLNTACWNPRLPAAISLPSSSLGFLLNPASPDSNRSRTCCSLAATALPSQVTGVAILATTISTAGYAIHVTLELFGFLLLLDLFIVFVFRTCRRSYQPFQRRLIMSWIMTDRLDLDNVPKVCWLDDSRNDQRFADGHLRVGWVLRNMCT